MIKVQTQLISVYFPVNLTCLHCTYNHASDKIQDEHQAKAKLKGHVILCEENEIVCFVEAPRVTSSPLLPTSFSSSAFTAFVRTCGPRNRHQRQRDDGPMSLA